MCTVQKNQFWIEFISIYREHEALWCVRGENYKNQHLREIGYLALQEKYQEIEPHAVVHDVKRRINAMRTCYRRELNKVLKSEASGAKGDDVYTPTLWYYDEMNFLRSHSFVKEGKIFEPGSLDDTNTVEITSQRNNKYKNTENLAHANTFNVKKRQSNYEEIDEGSDIKHRQIIEEELAYTDDFAEDVGNFIEFPAKKHQKRDDAEIFSESWAVLFRKCSPVQQIYAKRAIEEILLLGQLDKLAFNSYKFLK